MDTATPLSNQAPPEPVTDVKPYSQAPGSHHVFKDVYSFFGTNVQNSVAVYLGTSNWKLDLQLLESYSFPTVICDPFSEHDEWRTAVQEKKGKLIDWMKYLKEADCGSHFVNPKWIEPLVAYPGNFNGMRDLNGKVVNINGDAVAPVDLVTWSSLLNKAAALRNKSVPVGAEAPVEPHFALCKIELYGEEVELISSLLASKYRPSILYLRWSASPDESQSHCEAAGHLQSSGYRLISVNDNGFFLYHYSGQDIYSCASWLTPSMGHPLITHIQGQVMELLKSTEKTVETSANE